MGTIGSYVVNAVHNVYPNVRFEAAEIWGQIEMVQWVENAIVYSGYSEASAASRRVVRSLYEADYLINLANLKKHEHETAVTLCGKNHFGTMENCEDIHTTINDYLNGMGTYNGLVDLLGHREIGGKTLLFIIDGLWGAPGVLSAPEKWTTTPFNNDWPSSIFMSQDGVAIDSVGLDFLNAEWTLWDNADNFHHEAAQADNPPSGTFYDPENDGTGLNSLGVHEHWNNPQDKQYSRNLGTGDGIELISLESGPSQPEPSPVMTEAPWWPWPTQTPNPTPTIDPQDTPEPTGVPTPVPTATPTPVGNCNVSFDPGNSSQDVNSTFQIDVVVDSGNQELAAYGFTITYNANVLNVVDVEAGADGFLSAANTENPGEIIASGFDTSGTGPGSNLQVLIITFNAIAEGTSTLGLHVDRLVDGGTNTIGTACGNNGSVGVEVTGTMLGDANGDGDIDIVDALLTAQYYVGLDPANFIPGNADVNCDGTVDIVDALLIAQYYVGLISEFC